MSEAPIDGDDQGQASERLPGVGLPKPQDEHAAAVATWMLARKGFRIARTMDKAGAIVITAQCRAG